MTSMSFPLRLLLRKAPSSVSAASSATGLFVPMVTYAFGTLPIAPLIAANKGAAAPVVSETATVLRRLMIIPFGRDTVAATSLPCETVYVGSPRLLMLKQRYNLLISLTQRIHGCPEPTADPLSPAHGAGRALPVRRALAARTRGQRQRHRALSRGGARQRQRRCRRRARPGAGGRRHRRLPARQRAPLVYRQ